MADEAILRDAFKAFDADGSGTVDLAELKEVVKVYLELMNEKIDLQKVNDLAEKIMKSVDRGGDGKITLEEFIQAFK